ncbi:DNA/RNA nuclease SfsA [Oceanicoccus sp. KOV_DT_Chl]|uniref:DNA/RNA nuclease SfsA n=1 Tax=Oceanicoccus sp. KOV_DT_Chl TaxID=1904639 RepID=UPI000C7A1D8D
MRCPPLIPATLVKRYKRFLADVILDSGDAITVHCPNTGAMTGCAEPGAKVWLSSSNNPKRKYPNTWELVQTSAGDRVCIHSAKANALVKEAIENKVVAELLGYEKIRSEVKYGAENSRIDLLLENSIEQCFIEVKSVTLLMDAGLGVFPDAVSARGTKHLRELIAMKQQGHRAVLFFCVQHTGIEKVAPADVIDQLYADTFREAVAAGVEVIAYAASVTPEAISLERALPVISRQV